MSLVAINTDNKPKYPELYADYPLRLTELSLSRKTTIHESFVKITTLNYFGHVTCKNMYYENSTQIKISYALLHLALHKRIEIYSNRTVYISVL